MCERTSLRARDPHHVTKGGEDDIGLLGNGQTVINSSHGKHADRAAWAVNEFDVGGKKIFQAKAINGVSVPSAHFHDAVMAIGIGEAADLFRSPGDDLTIAKLA